MSEVTYPFNEGDLYFTVEGNEIIESAWDDQSEDMHNEGKIYYATLNEAVEKVKQSKLKPVIFLCFDSSIELYKEAYGHLYINQ